MIPRRQDCEGDRRSWRIAICRCDAVLTTLLRFHVNHFCAHLNRVPTFPRILELEMHSAVLRFTFCDDAECVKVSRYFAA